jgi:hypothetical protein
VNNARSSHKWLLGCGVHAQLVCAFIFGSAASLSRELSLRMRKPRVTAT